MGNAVSVKRELRFQQWVQQVKEYNSRPEGMSMTVWCKQQGIALSTFATRLHKVQDRCLDVAYLSNSSSDSDNAIVEEVPATFVEVPASFTEPTPVVEKPVSTTIAAVISCGHFKIEISESASEDFLLKLIGAVNHA